MTENCVIHSVQMVPYQAKSKSKRAYLTRELPLFLRIQKKKTWKFLVMFVVDKGLVQRTWQYGRQFNGNLCFHSESMNSVFLYSSQKKIACLFFLFNGGISVKEYENTFWNFCLEKPLDSNILCFHLCVVASRWSGWWLWSSCWIMHFSNNIQFSVCTDYSQLVLLLLYTTLHFTS